MRKLVIAALMLFGLHAARADDGVGLGIFVGEPTGLDIKLGIQPRAALDIVLGKTTLDDGRLNYGHVTYLYTLARAHGQSVHVPLRLGIGGALYGVGDGKTFFAARVPFEIGLRFRRSPLEIYGEIAFVLQLVDDVNDDIDGGVGLRIYF